jgi:hypothetical protein
MGDKELTLALLDEKFDVLLGHVTTMAKRVYSKEDEDDKEDEDGHKEDKTRKLLRSRRGVRKADEYMDDGMGGFEEEEYPDMMDEDKAHRGRYARYARHARYARRMGKDEGMDGMPMDDDVPMDDDMMSYDEEDDDFMMAMKLLRAVRGTKKGYAAAAKVKADEEDSPFGDKDSTVSGNETQPAGDQGGDREEETFGPGGMAYRAMLKGFNVSPEQADAIVKARGGDHDPGQEIAKALIPEGSQDPRAGKEGVGVLTREMQEAVKVRSFRDINRLRMDIGDLPRTLM